MRGRTRPLSASVFRCCERLTRTVFNALKKKRNYFLKWCINELDTVQAMSTTSRKRMKRGATRREDAVLVGVWIPKGICDLLDQHVQEMDSDRSKLIRLAIREKFELTTSR